MATIRSDFTLDVKFRGFITGSSIRSSTSGEELCRFFGGIPYALPPVGPHRWHRPRPLPPCYQYGTRASPLAQNETCGVCPQAQTSPLDSEDCLQLNIWVPAGELPAQGWPVYFYIHGGYLQSGSANGVDPVALISETSFKAIIVMPAYRLNVYGFLASHELLQESPTRTHGVGNFGFWDQRLALQWTYTNINYFGGDPSNITAAGYSAGAHSVFYQLAYDLESAPDKRLIKRVIMHANGPGLQPKPLSEHQEQFEELLSVLRISSEVPSEEKLRLLRETTPQTLRKALKKMRLHQFRAVTDGEFIRPTLFEELRNGVFAKKLAASGVALLIGESANEHFGYAMHRPPANSPDGLYERLLAEYPKWVVEVLRRHYFPGDALPDGAKSWQQLFGRIYADVQVHVTQRGFIDALCRHGAGHLIHRYRIDWRSSVTWAPKRFGATHGADNVIWFWGNGKQLPDEERRIIDNAFLNDYARFVAGQTIAWIKDPSSRARRLRADGLVDDWQDELWKGHMDIWNELQEQSARQIREVDQPRIERAHL